MSLIEKVRLKQMLEVAGRVGMGDGHWGQERCQMEDIRKPRQCQA